MESQNALYLKRRRNRIRLRKTSQPILRVLTTDQADTASLISSTMAPKSRQKKDLPRTQPSNVERKPPPNWPALLPLIPTPDLYLATIIPSQIITISNFWTSTLCKSYVSFLSTLPLTTTPGKPKRGEAVRVNDRYQIDDPAFAERLWSQTALRELVTGEATGATEAERKALWGGEVVGLNPNIRVYRYGKGQFFDQHCESPPSICNFMSRLNTILSCDRRLTSMEMMTLITSPCRALLQFQPGRLGHYSCT